MTLAPAVLHAQWFTTLWSTAVGAFVGAVAAFLIDWQRRAREEKRRRIAAANVALLTLYNMWWVLYTFESHIVRPVVGQRDHPLPLWLRMKPAVRPAPSLEFDIPALVFLLHSREPALLPRLILQQQRYRDHVAAVATQNAAIGRARERMSARGIGRERYGTDAELAEAVGIQVVGELRTITAAVIPALYDSLEDMAKAYGELLSAVRRELGPKNITAFELEQTKLVEALKPSPKEWVQAAVVESNEWPRRAG